MGGVAGFSACSLLALSRLGHAKGAARSEQGNLAVKQAVAAHSASVSDSATGDATTPMGPMPTSARWAYILDSTTNTVLLSRNAEERMPPSSLTKMMTAYVVFAFLASGRIRLEQMFPVSHKAWRMEGSRMFVPLGSSVSVEDLIRGMLIQSGNDACVVLAEGIAGSEERFVTLMNEASHRIGLHNSHFMNVTGLPADDHYMCARDVAALAQHLISDFPRYYHFFGEKEFTFNHIRQGNRNVLVDKGLADGLKTGHTDAGGFGLCASSEHNGNRIIVVINGTSSTNERAHEGERLMSWAFSSFETVKFLSRGQVVEPKAAVWMGEHRSVALAVAEDVSLTIPIGWSSRVQISVDYPSPIAAPVVVGQKSGHVSAGLPGQPRVYSPLYTVDSVEELGIVGRLMARFGHAPE
ncbi:D-alanyl-D-alanine carboxypeptidase family protein [Bombella pollinis]|uniref:serine-type D-Ala-D-Ala carboxypeptidase n=1 Tax=Bombella pollinis TaxID=2967337 RepID=A0ABT3WMB0_9PROT|nr:D-alanyl-D-alanine carboxypeptidase family protein [Bombella pollinis]MCX5619305.1 D-alanyl-D-alanine carboxypeptidase [Bombella pollinis]